MNILLFHKKFMMVIWVATPPKGCWYLVVKIKVIMTDCGDSWYNAPFLNNYNCHVQSPQSVACFTS